MLTVGLILGAVGVIWIYWKFGRKNPNSATGRFVGTIRGEVNDASRKAYDSDPVRNAQLTIDDAATEMAQKRAHFSNYGGVVKGMIRRVDGLVNELGTIENQLMLCVKRAGELLEALAIDAENQALKTELERCQQAGATLKNQKAEKQTELDRARAELESARGRHKNASKDLAALQKKVDTAKRGLGTKVAELNVRRFESEAREALTGMGASSAISRIDDAFAALDSEIDGEVAKADTVQLLDGHDDYLANLQEESGNQADVDDFMAMVNAGKSGTPSNASVGQ